MKALLAFAAGAVLAAGIVFFALRNDQQTESALVTELPAGQVVEPPGAAPLEEPEPPAQPVASKPAPKAAAKPEPAPTGATVKAPPQPSRELPAPPRVETTTAAPPPAPPVASKPAEQPPPPKPNKVTLTAGTLLTVRLSETLSSEKNAPGGTFAATLDQPVVVDGFVIAERGNRVEGRIVEAQRAGRVKGVAELAIQLVRFNSSDGQKVAIQTETFTKEGPTTVKEDAAKTGAAAGIGAAIGAIAGGGKGAAIGAAVGGAAGAGGVMATRGKPAELPVETRITFRLSAPVTITEKIP